MGIKWKIVTIKGKLENIYNLHYKQFLVTDKLVTGILLICWQVTGQIENIIWLKLEFIKKWGLINENIRI